MATPDTSELQRAMAPYHRLLKALEPIKNLHDDIKEQLPKVGTDPYAFTKGVTGALQRHRFSIDALADELRQALEGVSKALER